ncbi:MAG: hypothetical protein SD837_10465 [Candidatus Electrothrix scaldis]|nr:MAG: hypothetical protein SD837_10465 [Candidatus Electrothrix sp. GW3-3]
MKKQYICILFGCILLLSGCDNDRQLNELKCKIDAWEKNRGADINRKITADAAAQVEFEGELVELSTSIIKAVSDNNVPMALDIIEKYSPLPEEEFKLVRQLTIEQLNMIKPRFGEYVGYEFINSKKIGTAIVRHDCIVKCQNHILRWEFFYYKPKDKWFLNTFKWDDQIRAIQTD